jgi:hypothetical protein
MPTTREVSRKLASGVPRGLANAGSAIHGDMFPSESELQKSSTGERFWNECATMIGSHMTCTKSITRCNVRQNNRQRCLAGAARKTASRKWAQELHKKTLGHTGRCNSEETAMVCANKENSILRELEAHRSRFGLSRTAARYSVCPTNELRTAEEKFRFISVDHDTSEKPASHGESN